MSPDLTRLREEVLQAVQGLSALQTQAARHDRPGSWNIQQIVEHLILTYQLSSVNFESRLARGTPTRATPTFAQRTGQFVLISLGYFPPGRMAPLETQPSTPYHLRSGDELAASIRAELQRMDLLIDRAESLFADLQAISHPVLGPMSCRQWRIFHRVHGLHHVKQIRTILRQEDRESREQGRRQRR